MQKLNTLCAELDILDLQILRCRGKVCQCLGCDRVDYLSVDFRHERGILVPRIRARRVGMWALYGLRFDLDLATHLSLTLSTSHGK